MASISASDRAESFPMAAGYVLGYLIVLALVPFLLNSIPPTASWKVKWLGSAALLAVVLAMRAHYRSLIRSVLSPKRSAAVLKRLDYGTALILVGMLLIGKLLDMQGHSDGWFLLVALAVAVLGTGLVLVQRAQHVWFASSFLSRQDDFDDMDAELVQAAEEIKRRGSMQPPAVEVVDTVPMAIDEPQERAKKTR